MSEKEKKDPPEIPALPTVEQILNWFITNWWIVLIVLLLIIAIILIVVRTRRSSPERIPRYAYLY